MNVINLVPQEVKLTQTQLRYDVVSIDAQAGKCNVFYELYSNTNVLIERGNKDIPLTALSAIAGGTTDITALNQVLSEFEIQALENQNV